VSSHRQHKEATIDSQVAELRLRVEQDRHQLLEEHVLMDDGYSGSYLDRPGLDRLRDLARGRVIDLIYVHAPDRLARRYAHQALLIEELQAHSCDLIFLNQGPSDNPEGQLLVQIQGVIAEYERAKICDRLRRGKLHQAREGTILSWKAPYGYRYVPRQGDLRGRWEINEYEAPGVRALFDWITEEEVSIREATKRLSASPWRPRCGGKVWAPSSVRAILVNQAYTGVSYHNRYRFIESDRTDGIFRKSRKTKVLERPREEWIPVSVPVLVEGDIFRRVQERLKENKTFSRRNLQREGEYLLRCLVSCGVCGRAMVAHSRGQHTYYHCSASTDHVWACRPRRCPMPMVYAPDLDGLVWKEVESLLRSPELMRTAWEQQRRSGGLRPPELVEVELNRLDERIRDGARQIGRLVDGYQAGFVNARELGKRRARAEDQIEHWTEERNRLEAEKPKWREAKAVSENLSRFCEHALSGLAHLSFDEKQALLRKVIQRVIVTAGEVTLRLAFPLSTNSDLTSNGAHHAPPFARDLPQAP
jgi:site-specific DNA recombinase